MIAEPTPDNAKLVLTGVLRLLDGFVSDRNFVDLLRLTQVVMARGRVSAEELTGFVPPQEVAEAPQTKPAPKLR